MGISPPWKIRLYPQVEIFVLAPKQTEYNKIVVRTTGLAGLLTNANHP